MSQLLPFIHSPEDIIFLLLVFARVGGLFLVAPFFSNQLFSGPVRIYLGAFITIILVMVLYPEYCGEQPTYVVQEIAQEGGGSLLLLALLMAKELAIGYLIGFVFSLVFEALMLAGQQIGVMIGFSASELIDPMSGANQTLIGQFYMLIASFLILVFDLHHLILSVLVDSFHKVPIGHYHLSYAMLQDITMGTGLLFDYGLRFAVVPFVILFLVTVGLGFLARVMPEMNIFMVGFPLRILVGYYSLILAVHYFPMLLRSVMQEYANLALRLLSHIGLGEGVVG